MCGIVGVVGNIDYKAKKAFKDMIHMDILRGEHSVGIAAARLGGSSDFHKRAMLPSDFFQLKKTKEVLDDLTNTCLIGHNRYATVGAVSNHTAHPFECGDLLGVHNGTLRLRSSLLDFKDFAVDSENLYHNMANLGLQDTYDKLHQSLQNAWSLAWMNNAAGTFHLLRNSERPMCYCLSKDRKAFFFASEWWMLEGALARNGIEHDTVYITNEDELYTIKLPEAKGEAISFITKKMVRTPLPVEIKPAINKDTSQFSKSSAGDRQRLIKNLLSMKGSKVTFGVDCVPNPTQQTEHFDCHLVSDDAIGAKIFLTSQDIKGNEAKAALHLRLTTSYNYFKGTVKKVHFNDNEPYVTLDWRTIEELKEDLSSLDFSDEVLDTTENLGDCVWCSDPLQKGEFLTSACGSKFCEACIDEPQTALTITNMGYTFK